MSQPNGATKVSPLVSSPFVLACFRPNFSASLRERGVRFEGEKVLWIKYLTGSWKRGTFLTLGSCSPPKKRAASSRIWFNNRPPWKPGYPNPFALPFLQYYLLQFPIPSLQTQLTSFPFLLSLLHPKKTPKNNNNQHSFPTLPAPPLSQCSSPFDLAALPVRPPV